MSRSNVESVDKLTGQPTFYAGYGQQQQQYSAYGNGGVGYGQSPGVKPHLYGTGGGQGTGGYRQPQAFVKGADALVPSAPPTVEEQLNCIFVSHIPADLSDGWVEKMVQSVGRLKEWRRASDGKGRLRPFGFAIYEEPESTKRAMSLLTELELPELNGSVPKLIFNIDEQAQVYLDQEEEAQPNKNPSHDRNVLISSKNFLRQVLADMADPEKRRKLKDTAAETRAKQEAADEEGGGPSTVTSTIKPEELAEIPADSRTQLIKEIAEFRERSAKRERDRQRKEEEMIDQRQKELGLKNAASAVQAGKDLAAAKVKSAAKGSGSSKRDSMEFVPAAKPPAAVLVSEEDEEDGLDDERREAKKQEKRLQDQQDAFVKREKKWMAREVTRSHAIQREIAKDKMDEARIQGDRETMAKILANYDDDYERDQNSNLFYRDRALWARQRAQDRAQEAKLDEDDRIEELRESDTRDPAERLIEEAAQAALLQRTSGATPLEPSAAPIRLTLGGIKRPEPEPVKKLAPEILEDAEDEEDTSSGRRQRLLVPLDDDVEEEMDDETLQRRIVESIPSDKERLWGIQIKWDLLDDDILLNKIKTFATNKIIEYLGVQENDLIDFVVEHIKAHKGADELVKELEMVSAR